MDGLRGKSDPEHPPIGSLAGSLKTQRQSRAARLTVTECPRLTSSHFSTLSSNHFEGGRISHSTCSTSVRNVPTSALTHYPITFHAILSLCPVRHVVFSVYRISHVSGTEFIFALRPRGDSDHRPFDGSRISRSTMPCSCHKDWRI